MSVMDIENAYRLKTREEVLKLYEEVDLDDKNGAFYNRTAFHLAASKGDYEALEILINRGGRATAQTTKGETAFHSLATYMEDDPDSVTMEKCYDALKRAGASTFRKEDSKGYAPIHVAAVEGNGPYMKAAVAQGDKLELTDELGEVPLHLVARYGADTAKKLEKAKEDLANAEENLSKSPDKSYLQENVEKSKKDLEIAQLRYQQRVDAMRYLLEGGADPEETTNSGINPMYFAVNSGMKELSFLLSGGTLGESTEGEEDLSLKAGGLTLFDAVDKGDYEAMSALIQLGSDMNEVNEKGRTPLGCAISHLDVESVRLLLEGGADPNFKTGEGNKAFVDFFHDEMPKYIKPDIYRNRTIPQMLGLLLDHGFELNGFVDDVSHTPFHYACTFVDTIVGIITDVNETNVGKVLAEELIAKGCDVNLSDTHGTTPLMTICKGMGRHTEDMQLSLLEAGADVTPKDKDGNTALHYVAQSRVPQQSKTLADMLYTFGNPDANMANNAGKTPLDYATEYNNEPLVKFLLEKL